jgi:release factor glutamine methyltransferase
VLIPRPESELIVEAALALFPRPDARLTAIDVGTGSGCLAVSLAVERPMWTVIATDVSSAALEVARRNARRHGAGERVSFLEGDLFGANDRHADLVVSNPPYVPEPARPALQPEVRDYEPACALFGGSDGMGVVRRLVTETPVHLRPGGYLIFEFGLGHDVEVADTLAASAELELVDLKRDLQGIARTAVARRR